MSSSFSFSPEEYANLESAEAREAFKILMLASFEAKVKKAEEDKAEAEAKALVAAAKAEELSLKLAEQESFMTMYPEGYIYVRESKEALALKAEARECNVHVKTFLENVLGEGLIKVVFRRVNLK